MTVRRPTYKKSDCKKTVTRKPTVRRHSYKETDCKQTVTRKLTVRRHSYKKTDCKKTESYKKVTANLKTLNGLKIRVNIDRET